MKPAAHVMLVVCLAALTLLAYGCNYVKPVMYINIANHSGRPMENLEVKHPSGIFGLPELRNEQTHRRMTPIGTPCKFSIEFEDQAGKKYADNYDLGTKCPTEIMFDVGVGMSVSERLVRP
jgi:hypothetical protein